jgi:hypothetical protein
MGECVWICPRLGLASYSPRTPTVFFVSVPLVAPLTDTHGFGEAEKGSGYFEMYNNDRQLIRLSDEPSSRAPEVWRNLLSTLEAVVSLQEERCRHMDETALGNWAFWAYALIEQLHLGCSQGVECHAARVARCGDKILPSKPFASLRLFGGESRTSGRISTPEVVRLIFYRAFPQKQATITVAKSEGPKNSESSAGLRPRKRQRMQDVLSGFGF